MISTKKTAAKPPAWLQTLQQMMNDRGMSPRHLSLTAGLNPTAVRDMLLGRARNPRYDTIQALAQALGTTPAFLMGDDELKQDIRQGKVEAPERLDLLTEIIARIQETADDMGRKLSPKELATMATTLYRQILDQEEQPATLKARARTLVAYARNNDPVVVKLKK